MTDPEQQSPEPMQLPLADSTPAPSNEGLTPQIETAGVSAPSLPRRDLFPPWSAWDVGAVLCFAVAMLFVLSSAALVIGHIVTRQHRVSLAELAANPIVIIGSQLAAYPVVLVFMITLVRGKAGERFSPAIRWNWPGIAASEFLLSGIIVAFVVEFASRWLPIPKSLPMDRLFSDATGAYMMAVFGITLAPLLEELFFRGMLYPLIRRSLGVTLGVVATAAAFASIHSAQLGYAWGPLVSIFVVGVIFTLVRERTNSVAASFLMHSGYNATLFGMLWFASDHFRHLEKALN